MRTQLIALAVLAGCQAPVTEPNGDPPVDTPASSCEATLATPSADALAVADSSDAFGWDLYQSVADVEDGNLFFSPFSITAALSMTYAGAAGETADEMASVLHISSDDTAYHSGYGELIRTVLPQPEDCAVELNIANRLFGQDGFPWLTPFLDITAEDYGAPLEDIDFQADPEQARVYINDWVADQTAERITDLLPPGTLTAQTVMVLTNAIYFKADWMEAFKESETFDGNFSLADGSTVTTPLMYRSGEANIGRVGSVSALELPYDGELQSMVILLPDDPGGLSELEAILSNDLIDEVMASVSPVPDAEIIVPRFTIDARVDLKQRLIELGMPTAFLEGMADLTNMVDAADASLFIEDALHRAFIEVNEAGSEAAAATAVVVGQESAGPGFYADRPFVFFIRDNATGAVLFLGRVSDPTE